jgi:hypothetical protein
MLSSAPELWIWLFQNSTEYQYSEDNLFILDQRGYGTFLDGEADQFLLPNDTQLLYETLRYKLPVFAKYYSNSLLQKWRQAPEHSLPSLIIGRTSLTYYMAL